MSGVPPIRLDPTRRTIAVTTTPPRARLPRPPTGVERLGELRALTEPARLLARTPTLLRSPKTPEPARVVHLPGLGATDLSSAPLRSYLASLGHRVSGWGLGRHGRDPRTTTEQFLPTLEAIAEEDGTRPSLVGWSLGGVVARETARLRPDLVARVITYGTPLRGPRFTSASGLYSSIELQRIEGEIADVQSTPITIPVTAIYSQRDGVVDWTTCIDDVSPHAMNVEVGSSHIGMGLDPDVWIAVANALDGRSAAR